MTNRSDQFLTTDHLTRDLRGRSIRGGAATLFAQGCRLVIGLAATAVLARILTPKDYGLIGMVLAFTNLLALVKDLGLTQATIQQRDITDAQVSALFWINTAIGALLTLATAAGAPLLAWFYEEPRLTAVAVGISAAFVLGGLGVQHEALLRRQMRFTALAAMQILSATVGAVAGVASGLLGAGYWSLVIMQLAGVATELVVVWTACRWRPRAIVRGAGIRRLVAFGGSVMAANVLVYLTRNLDNVLIGRRWGPDALGLYVKAYDLLLLPMRQFNTPLTHVALPALSRLQDQPELFRAYYRRGIALLAFLSMPLVALTFSAAEPMIGLVLGEQWSEAVPLFRALAPAAFVGTFNVASGWVFLSLGRATQQLRVTAARAIVTVAAFVIGLHWGAMGVAISFSISTCLLRPFGLAYCFSGTPVRMADLGRALWRPATASITAGAALFALDSAIENDMSLLARMAVDGVAFVLLYLGAWAVLPGGIAHLREIMALSRELRRNRESTSDEHAGG